MKGRGLRLLSRWPCQVWGCHFLLLFKSCKLQHGALAYLLCPTALYSIHQSPLLPTHCRCFRWALAPRRQLRLRSKWSWPRLRLERGPPSCPWVRACLSGYWLESVEKERMDMGRVGSGGCLVSGPQGIRKPLSGSSQGAPFQTGWDTPGAPNAKLPRCCVAEAGPGESADGRANCGHGHQQTGFAMLSTQQSWGSLLGRAGERAFRVVPAWHSARF